MGLLSDRRLWGLVAGLAAVVVLGVVVAVLGLLELLAVLSGGATLLALVEAALPYLAGLAVLLVVGLLLLVGLAAVVLRQVSDGVDEGSLRRLAERVRDSDLLRRTGLSRRL